MHSIENWKKKIENWKVAQKNTKSPVQAALLNDKIMDAYQKIRELETKETKKEVKDHLDAPVLADRIDNNDRISTTGIAPDNSVLYSIKI